MPSYITEYCRDDFRYEGPQIAAGSWNEAATLAEGLGVLLVGELQSVTDGDGSMPEAATLNIGDIVKVRLNDLGRAIYRKHISEVACVIQPEVEVDDDGFTRMAFWAFLELFGPHISSGRAYPFEDTIGIIRRARIGQKVRWLILNDQRLLGDQRIEATVTAAGEHVVEGTVIAADQYGTTTTQDEPPAAQTWHHGPNVNLEPVD